MARKTPHFLRDIPSKSTHYTRVEVRHPMKVHNARAIENLSRLTVLAGVEGIPSRQIQEFLMQLATGEPIRSRLEPKSIPGKYRILWIPTNATYKGLLERLATVLGSFSTSAEASAFRKDLGAYKGLRGLLDAYELGCERNEIPKKQTADNEGHVIQAAYQGDIKNYYGTITYDQVVDWLRVRFTALFRNTLPQDACLELADLVADLVCPGEVLPQGFHTSPAIANGVGVGIDRALRHGLKDVIGEGQVGVVGRYADDLMLLTTSTSRRVLSMVRGVLDDRGFKLHPDKTHVTRELGYIDAFGARIRNDGDGPLGFGPVPQYTRRLREAMQWALDQEPDDVTDRQLQQMLGGLSHVHHVLEWGTPDGARLRKGQKALLPGPLETVWADFRERFEGRIAAGHAENVSIKRKQVRTERMPKPQQEVLEDGLPFGWKIQLFDDEGQGGKAIIKGVNADSEDRLIDLAALREDGFPEDSMEIDSFVYSGIEEPLTEAVRAFTRSLQEEGINSYEALVGNANVRAEFEKLMFEFVKWHLACTQNIVNLSAEDYEATFIDESVNWVNREGRPQIMRGDNRGTPIFPMGIGEVFGNFIKQLIQQIGGGKESQKMMRRIMGALAAPDYTKPAERRFVRSRTERNAKGGYLELPAFGSGTRGLRTASGYPIKKQ